MTATGTTLSSLAAMSVTMAVWGVQPATTDPTEPRPVSSTGPEAAASSVGFSVVAALGELPAALVAEAPMITMGDVTATTDISGLTRPDPTTSPDFSGDYARWMMAITGVASTSTSADDPQFAPVMVVPPSNVVPTAASVEALNTAIGFTFADVDWFAEVTHAPAAFSVYSGAFDESTLSPGLVPVADGVVSLGAGEDFSVDLAAATPLSDLGQPQRLAYRDGRIVISPDTSMVRDWLAATTTSNTTSNTATSNTTSNTAADDLRAAASALDDAGVVSAAIGRLGDVDDALGPATPEQRRARLAELGDAALDDVFDDEVAIGWRAVDGEPVMTVVYVLDDAADADAAVENVRRVFTAGDSIHTGLPLIYYLSLDEVSTDGTTVVATVRPGPEGHPRVLLTMLINRDLPFVTLDD